MPRNVRNFWIELDVDGRKERIATGPVRKDGGFELTVKMRDHGDVVTVWEMWGYAEDGKLVLISKPCHDNTDDEDPCDLAAVRVTTER